MEDNQEGFYQDEYNYRIEEKTFGSGLKQFTPQYRIKTYAPHTPEDGIQLTDGWINCGNAFISDYHSFQEARNFNYPTMEEAIAAIDKLKARRIEEYRKNYKSMVIETRYHQI